MIASPFPSLIVSRLHKRPLCFGLCFSFLVKDYLGECCFVPDTYSGLLTCALFESGMISGLLVMNFASSLLHGLS